MYFKNNPSSLIADDHVLMKVLCCLYSCTGVLEKSVCLNSTPADHRG